MPIQTNTTPNSTNLLFIAALEKEIHELKGQIHAQKRSDKHKLKREIAAQNDGDKKPKKHHRSPLLKELENTCKAKITALNKLTKPLENELTTLAMLCETYLSHLDKSIDETIASLPYSAKTALHLSLIQENTKSPLKKTYSLKTSEGKTLDIHYISLVQFKQLNGEPLPNLSLLHKLKYVVELLTEINTLQDNRNQKNASALDILKLIQNIQTKTQDEHEFKKTLSAHRGKAANFFKIPDKYSAGGKFVAQLKNLASNYPDSNSFDCRASSKP